MFCPIRYRLLPPRRSMYPAQSASGAERGPAPAGRALRSRWTVFSFANDDGERRVFVTGELVTFLSSVGVAVPALHQPRPCLPLSGQVVLRMIADRTKARSGQIRLCCFYVVRKIGLQFDRRALGEIAALPGVERLAMNANIVTGKIEGEAI